MGFLCVLICGCLVKSRQHRIGWPHAAPLLDEILMQTQEKLKTLVSDLHSPEVEKRAAAAEALCQALPDSASAVVDLLKACGDDDSVSVWACEALESMGEPPVETMDELVELCHSSNASVAYWAITLLGRLGERANKHQDELADVLSESREPSVKERAAWALGKVGADSCKSLAALELAAKSDAPRLSRLAKSAL